MFWSTFIDNYKYLTEHKTVLFNTFLFVTYTPSIKTNSYEINVISSHKTTVIAEYAAFIDVCMLVMFLSVFLLKDVKSYRSESVVLAVRGECVVVYPAHRNDFQSMFVHIKGLLTAHASLCDIYLKLGLSNDES